MAKSKKQAYRCTVVDEQVLIRLVKKATAGLRSRTEFFVQCDQRDCQYVDENELPCPLETSLFSDEIREREREAEARRQSDYD